MTFDLHPVLFVFSLAGAALLAVLHRHRWSTASPWLRVTALLLLAGVAAQPTIGTTGEDESPAVADVMLIIDRTTSMAAQDWDGHQPRMAGVAADVEAITKQLPGARWSVVTSDNTARIAAPWTTDAQAVVTLARTIGWREEGFGSGSDIAAAVPLATQLLQEAAAARPGVPRYLIYLGDGEQIASHEPASFAPLKAHLSGALVLGYGTEAGGVMAMRVDTNELVTRNGKEQRSKIDEQALQIIADQLGGSYEHRTAPGGLDHLRFSVGTTASITSSDGVQPLSWWLTLAAGALLVVDIWLTVRRLRWAKEER